MGSPLGNQPRQIKESEIWNKHTFIESEQNEYEQSYPNDNSPQIYDTSTRSMLKRSFHMASIN